jgi:hypothetical protein
LAFLPVSVRLAAPYTPDSKPVEQALGATASMLDAGRSGITRFAEPVVDRLVQPGDGGQAVLHGAQVGPQHQAQSFVAEGIKGGHRGGAHVLCVAVCENLFLGRHGDPRHTTLSQERTYPIDFPNYP